MTKSFLRVLTSLFFAISLIFIFGLSDVFAYSSDAETQGIILYVKPGANGTCTSWADACELQTALTNSVSGDQIWVAAGTYKPTSSTARTATFQLKTGVAIYGGFPAAGGGLADRDWVTYTTTLSGDIGTIGSTSDNSYHVVTGSGVDSTAILDGFTVTLGRSNQHGGGMYNYNGNPTLYNIAFIENYSNDFGGGMYNEISSPTLSNVDFSNNNGSNGGGMFNWNNSNPTLTDVEFSMNTALYGAGGMASTDSNPSLTNVTFSGNTANYDGGGMHNNRSNPILNNVTFSSNIANNSNGGGMFNVDSSPELLNVIFSGNTATGHYGGGGLHNTSSNPTMTNVTFAENTGTNGGGIYNRSSNPILINVTFSGNSAVDGDGGGMHNDYQSSPTLSNVTFSGNSASGGIYGGGGIINNYYSTPILTNVILWGNTPNQIRNVSSSSATVTYSLIQGGYSGTGNINADPLLGALADNGGFTQTHALGAGSPAIDTANPANCTAFDQRDFPRPIDGDLDGAAVCDMGSYEYGSYNDVSLTVEVIGSGTVGIDPLKPEYSFGDEVTLTAIADANWVFTGWSGDATGTDNPLTLTIRGETNITANFIFNSFTLNVSVIPEAFGSVTILPLKATYRYGDVVTITPTANPDYIFTGWSGDASGMDNPLVLTIIHDTNITANFAYYYSSLTVTVAPADSGTVIIEPDLPIYTYGSQVTLAASAAPGWIFIGWGEDASGSDNPLTITMQSDTVIVANFIQAEYTLTVEAFPASFGSVTVDPVQTTYHYGDQVILTALGSADHPFYDWSGAATGSVNPLTVTITGNMSITGNFSCSLNLTVTPVGSGSVNSNPNQPTYRCETVVSLTAQANPGWTFAGWSGNASGNSNPIDVTLNDNKFITASFSQNEYSLTVLINPTGKGTVTISPLKPYYYYGEVVTLTASPVIGWSFANWSNGATGNTNPVTVTITGNKTVVANFTQNQYTLTLAVNPTNSGTLAADPVKSKYVYGETVTLTATAAPGWTFSSWSGDASGSQNPLVYSITGNTSITANFTQNEYTLTLSVNPPDKGSVSVNPVKDTYHYGDIVTLTPSATAGWSFSSWGGDVTGTDNPLTLTIQGNTSIIANFTQDEYTLTVSVMGFGSVSVDPVQATYTYGTEVTLTATADTNFSFVGWAGDTSGSENPLTITIEGDTNILAWFTGNWIFLPMITR